MNYKSYVETITYLKNEGASKEDVLDLLEFDSDEYPDFNELKKAREEVYGD